MLVEHDRVVGERSARQLERERSAGVSTDLCPGRAETSTIDRREPELVLRAPRELDMPAVRRVERAAEEPDAHASSSSSSPTSTIAPLRAPAAFSARSSSSSDGGVPSTRKPPSVRSSRHARAFGSGL